MFKKVCKTCKKVIEYENEEELKKDYYFKGGYCRGTCKECEKKTWKKKYDDGTYNYRNQSDPQIYRMGYM